MSIGGHVLALESLFPAIWGLHDMAKLEVGRTRLGRKNISIYVRTTY